MRLTRRQTEIMLLIEELGGVTRKQIDERLANGYHCLSGACTEALDCLHQNGIVEISLVSALTDLDSPCVFVATGTTYESTI